MRDLFAILCLAFLMVIGVSNAAGQNKSVPAIYLQQPSAKVTLLPEIQSNHTDKVTPNHSNKTTPAPCPYDHRDHVKDQDVERSSKPDTVQITLR